MDRPLSNRSPVHILIRPSPFLYGVCIFLLCLGLDFSSVIFDGDRFSKVVSMCTGCHSKLNERKTDITSAAATCK